MEPSQQTRNNGPVSTASLMNATQHVSQTQAVSEQHANQIAHVEQNDKPLSDKEKEAIVQETVRYLIPQIGLINGIRHIAMSLCDNPASKMQLAEYFAVITPGAPVNAFTTDIIKLAISQVPEAAEAIELFEVWGIMEKTNAARQEAFKRYQASNNLQQPMFFNSIGYPNN